jgi:nitric oxide reductase NorD protein
VAEAEDVLLEAAERVLHVTRGLWRRAPCAEDRGTARGADARRRLEVWLHAGVGRSWPVAALDTPRGARWLARALGRPAPWQLAPAAVAATDGFHLLLPRAWLEAETTAETSEALLAAALNLGLRLAHGRAAPLPGADAAARDLYACLEGANADAWLVRRFPGLGARIDAVRRRALAARPALGRLYRAEAALEECVRALLAAPAAEGVAGVSADAGNLPDAAALAAFARTFSARLASEGAAACRGIAPVPHWGAPRAVASPRLAAAPGPGGSGGSQRRSVRLPRRVERREADPEESSRRGLFLPAPLGDAPLSVQDPAGLGRPRDQGEEEDLGALAEELASLEQVATLRSDEPVRERLVSEDDGGAGAAGSPSIAPDAGAWSYPEWDFAAGGYRQAACTLRETPMPEGELGWAPRVRRERAALLRQLRRRFEALRPRRERVARQLDGDDLDSASWVDEWADRRAGRAPEGRIYAQERARRRDVAVALLVDASGSTDAWVSGKSRVIDVAKETALCFCEALAALGDRHAVYAFSGRGAHGVRVQVAKRFAEPGGGAVDARIAGLAPDASTRLGAALRHVTARLAREPARVRLLLLLSDGKPNDDDEYGGLYGVEDARQAVIEARLAGVQVFCATIDRAGASYLPRLFGPTGYTVIRSVGELPWRLPDLHRRLTSLA